MDQTGDIKLPFHSSAFYSSGMALPHGVVHSLTASVLFNEDLFSLASLLTNGAMDSPRDFLTTGQVMQPYSLYSTAPTNCGNASLFTPFHCTY